MRFLKVLNNEQSQQSSGPEAGSGALDQIRIEIDNLLAAGDTAIHNALSAGNSQEFLRAARQHGGQ